MSNVEEISLRDLTRIRTGYTFRSKIEDSENETDTISVLQPRDLNEENVLVSFSSVPAGDISSFSSHLLDRGDLLIANKGTRLGTYLYQGHPEKCIASSSFFVIALHNREKVHPGFLYWYLNQPPAKVYLTKNLSGSTIPSLTKAVLENMKVRVPSLELQQHIVEFVEAIEEEKKLLRSLLRNRNEYCDNYIWNLIQSAS